MSQIPQPISTANYPNFYNQTVNKLNNIIPNKTNYYGHPLSSLIQTLTQNNLIIQAYYPNSGYLKLMFVGNPETRTDIRNNNYVDPYIDIYFQQPFNFQDATAIIQQYNWFWNSTAENFYKNLIVEKIIFCSVNGISDMSNNTK